MNSNDMEREICGFLYVKPTRNKHIAQKMRKTALVSSKVWKRHWCSVKRLETGLGIKVQFGNKLSYSSNPSKDNGKNNFIVIPSSAIVHRICSKTKQFAFGISLTKNKKLLLSLSGNSETETQRWIADIRHLLKPRRHCCTERSYNVSIIDNVHSRAAGLIGLHGDLITSKSGILIKNIYTGETARSFKWKEFDQFHLTTAGRPEDVKRICVVHTTKEFCCGIGELHIFCLNAHNLLQDLVTRGRGPKRRQSSLNSNNENLKTSVQHNDIGLPKQTNNILHCLANRDNNCGAANTSIASGIYEEIEDNICFTASRTVASNTNEDTNEILCSLRMTPPPLPPRQRQKTECVDPLSRIYSGEHSQAEISLEKYPGRILPSTEVHMPDITIIDSNYVPMSPQVKDTNILKSNIIENASENDYVMMR